MWVFYFTGVGAPTPLCLRLSCTFICAAYAVSAVTPSFDLQADGYGQYDPRGWGHRLLTPQTLVSTTNSDTTILTKQADGMQK